MILFSKKVNLSGPQGLRLIWFLYYYSTHCDTAQIWSLRAQYMSSALNRYPALYSIKYFRSRAIGLNASRDRLYPS